MYLRTGRDVNDEKNGAPNEFLPEIDVFWGTVPYSINGVEVIDFPLALGYFTEKLERAEEADKKI